MIVIDTSALMAVAQREPEAEACIRVLDEAGDLLMSAATFAEALIVSARRGAGSEMSALLTRIAVAVVPVTEADARRAADAYSSWGKGVHPAGLNLGDCFAYALAKERNCPLLFVGSDFAQTDVRAVDLAKGGRA